MNPQASVLGELPDEVLEWKGTAAELAAQCKSLLPQVGLTTDTDAANERLVRHYVQMGVLDRPDPVDGFHAQHIFDFLAARYLLKDGWPLAKIAELRAGAPGGLTSVLPSLLPSAPPGGRTPAERTLARLKSRTAPMALAESRPHYSASIPNEPSRTAPAAQAAELLTRRTNIKASLTDLGNTTGEVTRRRTLQLDLTPWCTVYVDASELARSTQDTPEILGNALTHALQNERIHRGEKP